jgi:hypothetical protein
MFPRLIYVGSLFFATAKLTFCDGPTFNISTTFSSSDAQDCRFESVEEFPSIISTFDASNLDRSHHTCKPSDSKLTQAIGTEFAYNLTAIAMVTMSSDDSATLHIGSNHSAPDLSIGSNNLPSSIVPAPEASTNNLVIAAISSSPTAPSKSARVSHTSLVSLSLSSLVSSSIWSLTTTVLEYSTASLAAASAPAGTATSLPAIGVAKRGVAYLFPTLVEPFIGQKFISWAYNWASTSNGISAGIEYIPMLWGNSSAHTSDWETAAQAGIAAGASALLSFNEPDNTGQSNISPDYAATSYKTYMSDMFGGQIVRLGSPAVTNGPPPMGLKWLTDFMSACNKCQIDFVVSFAHGWFLSIIHH